MYHYGLTDKEIVSRKINNRTLSSANTIRNNDACLSRLKALRHYERHKHVVAGVGKIVEVGLGNVEFGL